MGVSHSSIIFIKFNLVEVTSLHLITYLLHSVCTIYHYKGRKNKPYSKSQPREGLSLCLSKRRNSPLHSFHFDAVFLSEGNLDLYRLIKFLCVYPCLTSKNLQCFKGVLTHAADSFCVHYSSNFVYTYHRENFSQLVFNMREMFFKGKMSDNNYFIPIQKEIRFVCCDCTAPW